MKKKWIVGILAVLVVLAVLLLPLPQRVDVTLSGGILQDGTVEQETELSLRGWYFRYLVRQDRLTVDLTVTPFLPEPDSGLAVLFDGYVLSPDGANWKLATATRYSESENAMVFMTLCFADDFSAITWTDQQDQGHLYVTAEDPEADLAAIAQQLGTEF